MNNESIQHLISKIMKTMAASIHRVEFEGRIFISLSIVLIVCLISFLGFPGVPGNMILAGHLVGLSPELSVRTGFFLVALIMIIATLLRMWAGTVLSSERVMSFRVRKDVLTSTGPYKVSRNPIYLADLIAFCGFALCLSPIGLAMPVLLYLHYTQLITYEEKNLAQQFGDMFRAYKENTPWLIPDFQSILKFIPAIKSFCINHDGFRHNAPYLLFIPGFVLSAITGNLVYAMIIGLPAVFDWAVIHTLIGLKPLSEATKADKPAPQAAKLKKSKVFSDIIYAQCWEDPEIDRSAFHIGPDDVVFSITSGGCNVLAFLADNPKKVIALDLSPYQNYLLDLKMAAFREFDYEELLEFLGLLPSDRRFKLYSRLKFHMKPESIQYWDDQDDKILMGILHSGRYEKYMLMLKKWLNMIVGKSLAEQLFACKTDQERQLLYDDKWNNLRWRCFTRIFLSRTMMTALFTGKFFDQLDESFSFGDHFRSNIKRAITILPLKENYFLAYVLLGKFYDLLNIPVYLRKENFEKVKSRIGRIEIVTGSCKDFFHGIPDDSISKFNFSNIFEWMEPASFENLLKETVRVARDGSILTYRNLLVKRSRPESLARWIKPQKELSEKLHVADRSFIYRAYIVERITKN
jgi:S-adenosylmethionine-diacylglycerol 3-amino-3-carboxypropyl transferase